MNEPQHPDPPAEKGTRYVILKAGDDGTWEDGLTVQATSAKAAVQSAAQAGLAGVYVAVPERSWKPVKVTVETKQTVKLG